VLAFTAGSQLARLLEHDRQTLALAAAAALIGVGLWLALGALRPQGAAAENTDAPRIGFRGTFLLTLANPLTIALFAAFSGQLALSARWTGARVFRRLYFCWQPARAGVLCPLRRRRRQTLAPDPRVVRALNAASGAGIALFGVYGLACVL